MQGDELFKKTVKNNTIPSALTTNWQEEFEKKFVIESGLKDIGEKVIARQSPDEIKAFISSTLTALAEEVMGEVPKERNGKHLFEVGFRTCKYCGEPQIIYDRKRVVIKRDEESGGELAEVTENVIDQTGFPCSQNRSVIYNTALSDTRTALTKVLERYGVTLKK